VRLLLLLVATIAPVGFAVATASNPESFVQSIAEIKVNDQVTGPTLIVRRSADGALLLRQSDLAQLRLRTPSIDAITIDGERYYRFDTAMAAHVVFDDATQSVRLTLPPSAFVATEARAGSPDAPQVTPSQPGGFVNYDLYGEKVADESTLGAILEAGAFGSFGVLTGTLLGQYADSQRAATRLDTTWRRDFPARLETLRVGDSISTAGAWGQAVRFGGVQFGTNFSTQPTLVTTPMLFAEGEAVLPSTVDIFVNGQRVASEEVPPGPFTIDRVPPITGAGQLQVVVTDALGRQQVLSQPYYTGPTLLRAGLSEYSLEAGAIREDYAMRSNAYGDAVAAATLRRGISDYFTTEVHAEGQSSGAGAAGLDMAVQVGTLGVASLTAAAGGKDDLGWLGGIGFERNAPRVSVFARTRFASESFAQLGTATQRDRPKQRSFGGLGFAFGRYGNLQLSCGLQSFWTGPTSQVLGLSHSVTLGNLGYLSFAASHVSGGGSSTNLFLNWTLPMSDRRTASLGVEHSPGQTGEEGFEAVASLQKSLPPGAGAGYYMAISSSENAQLDYFYQGNAGLVGVQYARRNDQDGWRATANGGLALTSAGIMPARTLNESFAVVEVADYAGLTVYLENQPVGRTDSKGRVMLDSLRAYEANAVSIDPKELPLDASLATPDMIVTPAYRNGPVVRFPIVRASAATLRLVQADGTPVPAGASVKTREEEVPVALDGLVYLTAASGRQDAVAEWTGHRCAFAFERPDLGDPQPDLGTIVCDAAAGDGAETTTH
jgi:outer membrane usher protein